MLKGSRSKKAPMNATSTFSLRFAPASASKNETLDRLLNRATLQRIGSAASLISQAIGFFVVGMLIIVNRNQSELNVLSAGSPVAIAGGIGAILVGTVFLIAACFYCRFCTRSFAAFSAGRQTSTAASFSVQSHNPGNRSLRLSWRLLPG
jgi:ABC-type multidrug transport system permease subunit